MSRKLILGCIIGLFSIQTFAAPFGTFDARSLAMGGTGVASGDASNASHYNPALLATTSDDDDFSLNLPLSFALSDKDNLLDTISDFSGADYALKLDTATSAFNTAIGTVNAANIKSTAGTAKLAANNLKKGIDGLGNRSIILDGAAGVLMAIPSNDIGLAVHATGRLTGGANLTIASGDTASVTSYVNVLNCVEASNGSLGDVDTCNTDFGGGVLDGGGNFVDTDSSGALGSKINFRGAVISEVGVSVAHKFSDLDGVAIGITPKLLSLSVFDSSTALSATDGLDPSKDTLSYSDVNIDVGAVYAIDDELKVGLVAKNIIAKDYATSLGNTVSIKPQYRVGLAYQNDWALISADYDLVKNDELGVEGDTQFLALGMELDLLDLFQARVGFRQNTVSDDSVISLGAGMTPLGTTLDFAVAVGTGSIEAGMQFGVKF